MNFFQAVYAIAKKIPPGKVMTYGQIAAIISTPRAARVVGFAMRALPDGTDVPWQRVINMRGMISIENMQFPKEEQARLLRAEGINVVQQADGNFFVDLKEYLWQPKNQR